MSVVSVATCSGRSYGRW